MSKKSNAKTINGIRRYTCKRCGKPVEISHYKWRQLPTEDKRLCPDCSTRKNTPIGRGNAPLSPYSGFGDFLLGRF